MSPEMFMQLYDDITDPVTGHIEYRRGPDCHMEYTTKVCVLQTRGGSTGETRVQFESEDEK